MLAAIVPSRSLLSFSNKGNLSISGYSESVVDLLFWQVLDLSTVAVGVAMSRVAIYYSRVMMFEMRFALFGKCH